MKGKKTPEQTKKKRFTSRQIAIQIAKLCKEKKAQEIVILDVKKLTFLTDFFVILTAEHTKHSKALADDIVELAKKNDMKIYGAEGLDNLRWVLLDLGSVVVHIFEKLLRKYYSLEQIWADAKKVKF